jgi:uncharacterized RDD family membrane protein YckC
MDKVPFEKTAPGVEYPSLSERVQSTFIDTVLIIALMFSFASMLERYENAPDWIRIAMFFFIWGIYEPVCTSLGFTVGNYFKGIRVSRAADINKKINIFQALIRYIFKGLLGWISFLSMHLNPQRRAIHDFAAGSIMIKLNRS